MRSFLITLGLYLVIVAIILFLASQNSYLKRSLTEHRRYIQERDAVWVKLLQENRELNINELNNIKENQRLLIDNQYIMNDLISHLSQRKDQQRKQEARESK